MDETTVKKIKYQLKSKFKDISESDIEEFKLKEFLTEVCNYTPPPKNTETQTFSDDFEKIFCTGNFTSEQFIQLIEDNKSDNYITVMINLLFKNKNITMATITKIVKHYPDYIISEIYDDSLTKTTILQRPDMTFEMVDLMLERILKNLDTLKGDMYIIYAIFEKVLNEKFYRTNLALLHNAAFRIQNRYKNSLVDPTTEIGKRKINRDYDFFAKGKSES